jgi:YidC/Oxa1 family membrane protein insertase
MGALFNGLQRLLGDTLAFFFGINGGSFGLAIIMLTIAINIVLFPLTLRQTRATRAFQEIQPEIKRLQKEYKDDSQKMQQELMKVQREAGATPGGCLIPLLVQAPIWFALFRVLQAISDFSNGRDVVPPLPPTRSCTNPCGSTTSRSWGWIWVRTCPAGFWEDSPRPSLMYSCWC